MTIKKVLLLPFHRDKMVRDDYVLSFQGTFSIIFATFLFNGDVDILPLFPQIFFY